MMNTHINIINALINSYEKIFNELKSIFTDIRKNQGSYEYDKDHFMIYITFFPNEIEVVAELILVDSFNKIYSLDICICNPDGEIFFEENQITSTESSILQYIQSKETIIQNRLFNIINTK